MPATQTSCPADNTARAAILRPLALGAHQNLVYVYNEVPPNTSTSFGHLRRYDATTGQKIDIVTSGLRIDSAQLSANGQWVLFLSIPDPRTDPQHSAMLQLVRMDGQGLQTLYCAPALVNGIVVDPDSIVGHIQWSTDQQSIVFDQAATTLRLLNISNGKLTTLLSSAQSRHFYTPITWLDTHQLFLSLNLPDA
ncbi:MAG TPA: hypothetical protein VFN35_05355, partial [Ktedonobacteraceae bacterium]|nr:hypothetical protein [Ktedonobacteraceae bacterium]